MSGEPRDRAPDFEARGSLAAHHDAVWTRAAGGEALDLGVLARREGVVELLRIARRGGLLGRTALLAIPHAPDAELAMPVLCDWLLTAAGQPSVEVLTSAMHALLVASALSEETTGAPGMRRCAEALRASALNPAFEAASRDKVASIQAMWAFRVGR